MRPLYRGASRCVCPGGLGEYPASAFSAGAKIKRLWQNTKHINIQLKGMVKRIMASGL